VQIPSVGINYNITSGGSFSTCSGTGILAMAALSTTAPSTAFTYSWSPSTFLNSNNLQSVLITPTAAAGTSATIIYSLVVTPTAVNCPHPETVQVTVGNPLTPTLNPVFSLCSNSPTFQVIANPGGGVFSGGPDISVNGIISPTFSFIGNNNFSYSYSLGGCTKNAAGVYMVYASPTVSVSAISTVCAGNTATLTAGGANTYSWSTSASSSVILVNPVATSVYSVTGTYINGNCSDSESFTVTVYPKPFLVFSGPDSVCLGKSANLSVSGADKFLWYNNASTSSIVTTPLQGLNTYSVQGTFTTTGCLSVANYSIYGIPYPTITVSGAHTLCAGETLSLTASGANTYAWNNTSASPTFTAMPVSNTVYTVTGSNEGLCYSSSSVSVSVDPCLGLSDLHADQKIRIFYSSSTRNVKFEADQKGTLQILDMQGKILQEEKLNTTSITLDVSNYCSGVYLFRFIGEKNLFVQKLIVDQVH